MTLRCKPGDLAVIVKSICGNEGKIITCIKLHTSQDFDVGGDRVVNAGPRWVIDRLIPAKSGSTSRLIYTVADAYLRPLRGEEGQDETLTWLDVPSKVDSLNSV